MGPLCSLGIYNVLSVPLTGEIMSPISLLIPPGSAVIVTLLCYSVKAWEPCMGETEQGWVEQAQYDLDTARAMLASDRYL